MAEGAQHPSEDREGNAVLILTGWPPKTFDKLTRPAPGAARRARRLPVPGRRGPRALRGQGELDPQAGRLALQRQDRAGVARVPLQGRLDRLRRHRQRGRGPAGGAALHQAAPAALQHPAARRQVLPLRRHLAGGARSRACTSRASATAPSAPTSARSRAPSACARRSTCWASSSRTARATGPSRAGRPGSPCLDYYIKRCQAPCVDYITRGGVPRQHRGDHPLPVRPLPPDRARARAADDRRGRGAGVRAGGRVPQPAARGALAVPAPADRERLGRHARRARRRGRGHRGERAGLPGARRRARRPPELLPGEPRRPQRGRGRRGVRDPVLLDLAVDPRGDRRAGVAGRGRRS